MSAAAIGDPIFIAGFRLVGVDGFAASSDEAIESMLKKFLEEGTYKMIILPERFVSKTKELRSRLMREGRVIPIFAFIPDYTGIKGERIEELKRSISLAVGAELKM